MMNHIKQILVFILFLTISKTSLSQATNLGDFSGTNGNDNTYIGKYSGNIATGLGNTFLGYDSGKKTTYGSYNVFLGLNSGKRNVGGSGNVFLGLNSGINNFDGSYNVFNGASSGQNNTTGYRNVFLGSESGSSNTTGKGNVYIGYGSGYLNQSKGYNTFIGTNSGRFNKGGGNVFLGNASGFYNNTGAENVFLGTKSGYENKTGFHNVFLGQHSGKQNETGYRNVFLGPFAGGTNISGHSNIFIGNYAGYNELGNNKLYIDNSSTNTPLIYGDFNQNFVNINGNLGIGTQTPAGKLHVEGLVVTPTFKFSNSFGDLQMRRVASNDPQYRRALVPSYVEATDKSLLIINYGGDFNEGVKVHGSKLHVEGNLAIGTSVVPSGYKLAVAGKMISEEVKVNLRNADGTWPDYVFNANYNLLSLEELEAYIYTNKHLPNIPSAQEVKDNNGIELGEMNAKLLEKIEELTLYTIQQQKELEAQNDKNNKLEERLAKIEALLKDVEN